MAAIWAVSLLAAGGCLFEPREAQDPGGGGEDTWIDPQVPEDVFLNLQTGLSEAGNSNYERSLSDNFVFTPRPPDANQYPQLNDWNRQAELNFLNVLKGDYPVGREIRFGDEDGNWEEENPQGTNPYFQGEYLYTINDGTGEVYYGGIARFTFEENEQGRWVLMEWEDIDVLGSQPTEGTGGQLRGRSGGA
jgi:hypothetical protein